MGKKHTIYITTNLNTRLSYVGYHSTNNIKDKYLGSGRIIQRSIKKHGRKNFKKEILEICNEDNWEERETFWINEKNTKWPNGYNLTDGGEGAVNYKHTAKAKKQMSKIRQERNLAKGENNGMFGQSHSKESKLKMGNTRKERGTEKGKNNPRFDHNIYNFKNKETGEIFKGHKFDLANKIGSLSCHINAVINGSRSHHKKWIVI